MSAVHYPEAAYRSVLTATHLPVALHWVCSSPPDCAAKHAHRQRSAAGSVMGQNCQEPCCVTLLHLWQCIRWSDMGLQAI